MSLAVITFEKYEAGVCFSIHLLCRWLHSSKWAAPCSAEPRWRPCVDLRAAEPGRWSRRWLTSSRQRSYCSLWLSFSRARLEFFSWNNTLALVTRSNAGSNQRKASITKVRCQLWTGTANKKHYQVQLRERSRGRKLWCWTFVVREFGSNKNISFAWRAARRRAIDLPQFPICQRQAAH